MGEKDIEALLEERRVVEPSKEFCDTVMIWSPRVRLRRIMRWA